jgi:hypothetical protein
MPIDGPKHAHDDCGFPSVFFMWTYALNTSKENPVVLTRDLSRLLLSHAFAGIICAKYVYKVSFGIYMRSLSIINPEKNAYIYNTALILLST